MAISISSLRCSTRFPASSQVGTIVSLSNVPVTNGVFSVNLNFGNQFPGANRFLEISVRQSGGAAFTTLTPRQPLTSSPYSVKSQNADSLGGIAASSYVLSGAASINAATQFNIAGNRILSAGGTDNTFVGFGAGDANTGADNSFFGRRAGQFNTTGSQNAFFGEEAGFNNTVGGSNSFFGENSGNANTSGSANSFSGEARDEIIRPPRPIRFSVRTRVLPTRPGFKIHSSAKVRALLIRPAATIDFSAEDRGVSNNNGNSNSFFGIFSGDLNTTGSRNVFIGSGAGFSNTTGSKNVRTGHRCKRRRGQSDQCHCHRQPRLRHTKQFAYPGQYRKHQRWKLQYQCRHRHNRAHQPFDHRTTRNPGCQCLNGHLQRRQRVFDCSRYDE